MDFTLELSCSLSGGSALDKAPQGPVSDFVSRQGGHSVITKVLICNNGIAAVKEIRSIRKWAYETFGDDRAIEFTVMATLEDLKVNADYIRMAEQYVQVPGGSNNNNYANVELIVDIAERAGVHAVWAGWGHASENPRLPERLAASPQRIIFIGPPGSAMRALGDKISSTIVAQHAGVACMPWSGSGITDTTTSDAGFLTVTNEVYMQACAMSVEAGLAVAERIGFPVMIKASEGGGGKGIRMCKAAADFRQLYNAAAAEVPGSPIFIMKFADGARHLEVQLLADQYGNAISIFGRDCSIQRRHQKVVEEAPVTIAPQAAREAMEKAAVRLAKLVGYVSAGTVEWLYSPESGEFAFLELNPRLQVEHPTTEMISGVNIPAVQLQIAMGIPLDQIEDIRLLYGMSPNSLDPIDFTFENIDSYKRQKQPEPKGHVVACRITAENPDIGFKPGMGALTELTFRSSNAVWGYFSVQASGGVHEYADSQFGHLFAYSPFSREEARKSMVVSLKELSIRGEFRTNVEYLIQLLQRPEFIDNSLNTDWLDRLIVEHFTAERPPRDLAIIAGASVHAHLRAEKSEEEYKRILGRGQIPPLQLLETVFTDVDFVYEGVKYSFTVTRSSRTDWCLFINGGKVLVSLRKLADGGMLITLGGGKSHSIYVQKDVGSMRLSIDARTCIIETENDPTLIVASCPGKLQNVLVQSGYHVKVGEVIAEIEVMKMVLPVVVAENATVTWLTSAGSTIAQGDVLGVLTLDDPASVRPIEPFHGQLPDFGLPSIPGNKPEQRFLYTLEVLHDVLDGFDRSSTMHAALCELGKLLKESSLPFDQTRHVLSAISGRIPARLEEHIRGSLRSAATRQIQFPAARLRKFVRNFLDETVAASLRGQVEEALLPLDALLESYASGLQAHEVAILASLLERYSAVEANFTGEADTVLHLRQENEDDLQDVVAQVRSHVGVSRKNTLILAILEEHVAPAPAQAKTTEDVRMHRALGTLAALKGNQAIPVALKAREVIIRRQTPSLEDRQSQMKSILEASVSEVSYGSEAKYHTPKESILQPLVDSQFSVFDVLHTFWGDRQPAIASAAVATYIYRTYRSYHLADLQYDTEDLFAETRPVISWRFKLLAPGSFASRRRASEPALFDYAKPADLQLRQGVMTSVRLISDLADALPKVLRFFRQEDAGSPIHVLNVAICDEADTQEARARDQLIASTNQFKNQLTSAAIRRVTYLHCRPGQHPFFTTLMRNLDGTWAEEPAIRNIEPALAYQLELKRVSKNFAIVPVPITSAAVHVYFARSRADSWDTRFYVRAVSSLGPGSFGGIGTLGTLVAGLDKMLAEVIDILEVAQGQAGMQGSENNHVFLSSATELPEGVDVKQISDSISGFVSQHTSRLSRLRVSCAEIRLVVTQREVRLPLRFFVFNETGFEVEFEAYHEHLNQAGVTTLRAFAGTGRLEAQAATFAYESGVPLQSRRARAHNLQTMFAHDFVSVFREALRASWKGVTIAPQDPLCSIAELVFDEQDQILRETQRAAGSNKIGMVAWILTILTPEYPRGRRLVVIANDVTVQAGSFGPAEDQLFAAASKLARQLKIPRLYLSANSGARIGLAPEALDLFKVRFVEDEPTRGFEYLYLDDDGLAALNAKAAGAVTTEVSVATDGTNHHIITNIIGMQRGIGVECLSGSGLIAGETSQAVREIFTATIVTGRSVGIGAYLARLGERVIQVEGSPIILTGYQTLNKLLGREVYTSNLQLGGPQIMYRNGVSHLTATDDLAAVKQFLQWMAYVPEFKGAPLPLLVSPLLDTWDRTVNYEPPVGPYDPRHLLEGAMAEDGKAHLGGLFDRGSWHETLAGWATSVVVGRARLGGIPIGVVAVETRTMQRIVPADPANPNSHEHRVMEAGQVWYPNSAYKTAQAISDIDREGLPLFILANWRGFSGGQEDMSQQILKFGSMIVNALVEFKQPVFVYLPPRAELRGGAWVVVDSTISKNGMIEMYADPTSRGGTLEPDAVVSVKYRLEKQRQTMARLDPRYAALTHRGDQAGLAAREKEIGSTFSAIAVAYADLHDKSGRMAAVGAIRSAVPWSEARRYFYQRLRRRLLEEDYITKIQEVDGSVSRQRARALLDEVTAHQLDAVGDVPAVLMLSENLSTLEAALKKLKREVKTRNLEVLLGGLGDETAKERIRSLFAAI